MLKVSFTFIISIISLLLGLYAVIGWVGIVIWLALIVVIIVWVLCQSLDGKGDITL